MNDIFCRTVLTDSKGRSLPEKDPHPNSAKLHEKQTLLELEEPGDYCWQNIGYVDFIELVCPFCGREAPLSVLVSCTKRFPLTLGEEVSCGFCSQQFHVIDGEAFISWGRLRIGESET